MLAAADDERRGVCSSAGCGGCACAGGFLAKGARFPSIYIVCFVLGVGGAVSFLIYGDLVIYEEDKKRGLKRGASSLVVWLGVLAVAVGEGRQTVEAALAAACVVEMDVVGDGLGKGVVVVELVEVVHFAVEGAPEGFHGAVVDAHAGAGHALEHALVEEFDFEFGVGVLKAAVAVHERVSVGVFGDGAVEGGEDEAVVVAGADVVGDDVVGFEVKDGGEIEFLAVGVLKFGDVGEPFFVGLGGVEVAGEEVGWQLNEGFGVGGRLLGADDGAEFADFGEAVEAFFVVVGVVDGVVFVG